MRRIVLSGTALLAVLLLPALADADDIRRARELLSEARGLLETRSLEPEYAANLWADIGLAQAKVGEGEAGSASFTRSWKAATAIKDSFRRGMALNRTAAQQIRAGQIREAIAQTRAIAPVNDQWSTLLAIANVQESDRDFAGARQTIDAIPAIDAESRARKLAILAESYAADQDFAAVLSTYDRIQADCPRAQRLLDKAGSDEKLSPAERSIVGCAGWKRTTLIIVVANMNKAGKFDTAIQEATRFDRNAERELALQYIAKAAADADKLDPALKCLNELTDRRRKDDAAPRLVAALARTGRFKDASDLTDRIQDRTAKASAIFEIAEAYAARGDERSVRKEYDRVMMIMRGTWGLVDNGQKQIVAGFLHRGHIAEAVSFVEQLDRAASISESSQPPGSSVLARRIVSTIHQETISEAYQGIATAAAQAGKQDLANRMFEKGRAAAERINNGFGKVGRFRELAVAQADAGAGAAALATLESAVQVVRKTSFGNSTDSADVDKLVELAITQAIMSGGKSARETLALAIESLSGRSSEDEAGSLLQNVARTQAWIGDVDELLRVARREKSTVARAHMLVGVVQGILKRREGKPTLEKTNPLRRSFL